MLFEYQIFDETSRILLDEKQIHPGTRIQEIVHRTKTEAHAYAAEAHAQARDDCSRIRMLRDQLNFWRSWIRM